MSYVVHRNSDQRHAHLDPSARQLARTVAPGVASVATRQSIRCDKPFPSARCVSASESPEATGDPFAPLVRLSAPPGQGRLTPPHCKNLRLSDEEEASEQRTLREERAGRPSAEWRETGRRNAPQKRNALRREGRRRRSRSDARAPAFAARTAKAPVRRGEISV